MPTAVAYDSVGNLFFADTRRHQVFELTLAGVWSVVAGNGEQGFAGDGGPAAAALLNSPRGLAVAADGTLYIADSGNQRIRAVANGVISTVAGSGVRGYSGDGPSLQVALRDPSGLAMDAGGNLLLCDTGNQRVRRMSATSVVTIAGNGVQGYGGDGGAATAAELDTPLGVAVRPDGTILIADTHNQRVRSLETGGVLRTFAGNGAAGYAGDGGPATLASLNLPYGVAVGSDGSVLIADAGNQRIRSVSAAGLITTLAGNGVQGVAADAAPGSAAYLNNPRAVGVQHQGQPVMADTSNGLVRELGTDNALYTLALLAAPRASSTTLKLSSSAVYGQGSANVSVTGSAAIPQGSVELIENGAAISAAELTAGSASVSLGTLGVGTHALTATYAGDGLNGSSSSPTSLLTVTAAPVVASAVVATAVYGAPLPSLTGTVMGILPQDAASIHAQFSSTAGVLSPAGTYTISAALNGQGSANYLLSLAANSGSLTISQAGSITVLSPVSASYAGLPILFSANVASATTGKPSGSVDFLDGVAVVGSAAVVNGVASTSVLAAAAGTHAFSARYNGDANFLSSTSPITSATVVAVPDFNLAMGTASQSVQGGSVAVFLLSVSPQGGPFTGAVALSVAGLPAGATASFSPASVVPGSSAASVTLSVQTAARSGALQVSGRWPLAAGLGVFSVLGSMGLLRRRRRLSGFGMLVLALASMDLGCGTRTVSTTAGAGQNSTLTIRGTGTNLAGAAVAHSTTATLTVF